MEDIVVDDYKNCSLPIEGLEVEEEESKPSADTADDARRREPSRRTSTLNEVAISLRWQGNPV